MTVYDWSGFLLVALVLFGVTVLIASVPPWRAVRRLVLAGFLLRLAGSIARHEVLFRFYGGLGDAVRYFQVGNEIAARLVRFDLSALAPASTLSDRLWGTPFVERVSGVVLAVLGPSMRGEFLVFAFLSFAGLLLMARAFQGSAPDLPLGRYLAWLCLWPSLWFWPASIGKEALMLLATGMVLYGYAGGGGRLRWVGLAAGLALALAVRPHYAAVLAVSLAAAHWVGRGRRWTPWRVARALGTAAVAAWVLWTALANLGLGEADLEGVQELIQYRSTRTAVGGSSIEVASGRGLLAVPLAFVNILLRPFPWEAHNAFAALSALEMVVFWIVVWRRRHDLARALRGWRRDRLLCFALPLVGLYVLMIGLTFGNLGIISRQRTLVFPFLFLLLERAPSPAPRRVPAPAGVPAGPRRAGRPALGPRAVPRGSGVAGEGS